MSVERDQANIILEGMLISERAAEILRKRGHKMPVLPGLDALAARADEQAKKDIAAGYRIIGPVTPRGPVR